MAMWKRKYFTLINNLYGHKKTSNNFQHAGSQKCLDRTWKTKKSYKIRSGDWV